MEFFLPVTLEELKSLSDEEVVKRINAKIAPRAEAPFVFSLPDFVSAQFYMAELDRREKRRDDAKRDENETRRRRIDLLLEGIVIGLIGMELILAAILFVLGGRQQSTDVKQELKAFGDMQVVLSHMQETSKATADAMTMLRGTTETMNSAVQTQLGLMYDVDVITTFDNGTKRIGITNLGHTTITLLGSKFWDLPPKMEVGNPRVVPALSSYSIDGTWFYNLMTQRISKAVAGDYAPWVIYVRNAAGKKITVRTYLVGKWENDTLTIRTQIVSIRQEE